ncbi:transposase [Streptomyces minutiscleroticus]|uniref:Transposase n=1 Tax=Streptomyces minutiscleroticus TaxID=68238 RepID=A0A918P1S7_9ACTN|nr:transposase [Streptomyces minutiscleroticus]
MLLPQLSPVVVDSVVVLDDTVVITARTRDGSTSCTGCGDDSAWEHSRYQRHVADEAVGGRPVRIDLTVRRLYCENPHCPKTTFAEQVEGLTVRYQRRTPALQAVVAEVAVALAGKAGSRLLVHLHHTLSWATLLNCVMALPDPSAPTPMVLVVDDFALRRGRRYGTLLVDADSRLPIEVWDTREAEPLTAWLRAHEDVEVVCRDGSSTYRRAIRAGAPQAVQVSDRFHLWQGLGRKVYEVIAGHRGCLPDPEPGAIAPRGLGGLTAARTRRLHAAVHALMDEGMAIRAIARHLDLDRNAVRRYARATTWQQAAPTWPQRAGILAPYQSHLHRRWNEGEHNIAGLFREVAARGFAGSEGTVRLYVSTHRKALDAGLPPPAPARSVFEVSRLLMSRPEHLDEDQRTFVKHLRNRCPELATLHDRIHSFATVFTEKRITLLDRWITRVKTDGIPQLVRYANGLLDDLDAVRAGVALPHSSGVAEGRVTDLKLIKRQMAGKAGIPLLRKRVILVAHSRRTRQQPVGDNLWMTTGPENLV